MYALELGFRGRSYAHICLFLGVRKILVYKALADFCRHGIPFNPHARKSTGRPRILTRTDELYLYNLLRCHPTLYLDKIQDRLLEARGTQVTTSTLSRTLRRMLITSKMVTAEAFERNELIRAVFRNRIATIAPDPNMLMFTDESAKDRRTHGRRRGWAVAGRRCYHKHFRSL
ncbi:hypothetical protein BXZ70DRAFT_999636 [Cristinia sonorae]|uniref:Transposase n=1 Tax=Cristinia sonorae TaxID=1940300 RepID=A0A8K0USE4_9AGAR|nr:hypothetical protein BXZ70DRAFT_999636 [Cristinia sonorae]